MVARLLDGFIGVSLYIWESIEYVEPDDKENYISPTRLELELSDEIWMNLL